MSSAAAINGVAVHASADGVVAAAPPPLSADAADVAHPLHLLRIAYAPDGDGAAAAGEAGPGDAAALLLPWLNAPAAAPAATAAPGDESRTLAAPHSGGGTASQHPGCPGPPLPALLVAHLGAVRRLQSQVPLFKHQLRALLDCWMARPDPRDTAAATAAAAAAGDAAGEPSAPAPVAAASLASRHADETAIRTRALREVYVSLVHGLTQEAHRITVRPDHSAPYQARQLFSSLDSTLYSPSLETQDSTRHGSGSSSGSGSGAGSAAARNRVVNYDYGGKKDSLLAATTPWLQGRPPALMTDRQQKQAALQRRDADADADADGAAEDERLYRASGQSATAATASTAAAAAPSSDLSALLSSSVASFNMHSALLLNLVQCSGLNPFEQMQQRIRTQYVLPASAPAPAVSAAAAAAASGTTATSAGAAAAAAAAPPAQLSADAHVTLLDALLMHFLRVQHGRNQETCTHLTAVYHAQQQAAIHSSGAAATAAAAAASASGAAGSGAPTHAAAAAAVAAARDLPPPCHPALPFLRKVFAPSALASPYAPRPAPPSVSASASASAASYPAAAAAAFAARTPNPVLGLVFSLPHTLHAYVEFERDDDEDEEEEEKDGQGGEDAGMHAASAAATSSTVAAAAAAASSASRGLSVSRISVVHWSELSTLVDGHSSSAFGLHRAVAAQAQLALWYFRQLVDRQVHAEGEKQRAHTSAASGATSASAPPPPASPTAELLRHKPLRVLHYLLLWLCSYWDLQSRACAECKLHLSIDAPHALSLAHADAAAAAAAAASDVSADPSLLPCAPLSHSPLVPLPPVVRMVGTEMRDYVSLHRACVEPYTLAHARS